MSLYRFFLSLSFSFSFSFSQSFCYILFQIVLIWKTYFFQLLCEPLVLFCQRLNEHALLLFCLPLHVCVVREVLPQLGDIMLQLVHPRVELLLGDLQSASQMVLLLFQLLKIQKRMFWIIWLIFSSRQKKSEFFLSKGSAHRFINFRTHARPLKPERLVTTILSSPNIL